MYQMTPQVVFNRALYGIRMQGGPSLAAGARTVCVYRGVGGRACGIGQGIGDQEYDPSFDETVNSTVTDVLSMLSGDPITRGDRVMLRRLYDALVRSGMTGNMQLLISIQTAHDDASVDPGQKFMDRFERAMQVVARQFNLEYTCPTSTA